MDNKSAKNVVKFLRLRYTRGNSMCSLIELSSLLEHHFFKNNRWFHWGQMLRIDTFSESKLRPVFWECWAKREFLSKHAADLECSLVLVCKARGVHVADVHTAA